MPQFRLSHLALVAALLGLNIAPVFVEGVSTAYAADSVSPAISKMLVEDYVRQMQERQVEDSFELLTTREREVLQLLAEGKSNKEAAAVLNLSLHTVETHRSNILQKLNLHSGAELILYAIRKGVIS